MRMNGPRGLCSRSVLCCLVGLRRLWVPTTTPARPEDCQSATTVNRTVCCNLHASEGARPPKPLSTVEVLTRPMSAYAVSLTTPPEGGARGSHTDPPMCMSVGVPATALT